MSVTTTDTGVMTTHDESSVVTNIASEQASATEQPLQSPLFEWNAEITQIVDTMCVAST